MVSRRGFIFGSIGVGSAVIVGGGIGKATQNGLFSAGEGDGFAAWDESLEGMSGIAAAGVLAASSHNTQPWSFRVSDDGIDVLGDRKRLMGAADPRLRELHISLGCAIENMAVAAAAQGLATDVEIVRGGSGHFARLTFKPGLIDKEYAALAEQIPLRSTNRGAYDADRAPGSRELSALSACAAGVSLKLLSSAEERSAFSALTVAATEVHVADAEMQRDSHAWYRMTQAEVERYQDGITIDGAAAGIVGTTFLKMFPPTPDAFDEQWAKVTGETHCATAPMFGLLVASTAGDHAAWIAAGRAYQRIQLEATRLGIATHPLSQSLAVRDRDLARGERNTFAEALDSYAEGGEVVLAFRLGYPKADVPRSPRRALADSSI
ncbi:MAG: hypothetical protein CVT66_08580 [Actinobacteria bacterium HGW-Actinobacteria-6]|jgi:nitroreductase|nr:MAG: hypothetical protein CVT66_08580 [Actinobacteria bacterium HGW-Actinobacteria-6]